MYLNNCLFIVDQHVLHTTTYLLLLTTHKTSQTLLSLQLGFNL